MLFKLVILPIIIVHSILCSFVLSYESWYHRTRRHHGQSYKSRLSNVPKASNPGRGILQPRITGGTAIWYGRAPYQLYYTLNNHYQCGATLVEVYGVQVALTATHCLWKGTPNQTSMVSHTKVKVIAGDLNLKDNDGREQTRDAAKIICHGSYDARTFTHDLTLIFLESPFKINEWVDTATLPGHNWDQPESVVVTGWGQLTMGGPQPDFLQLATVPTYDFETCVQYNQLHASITENKYCVGVFGGNGYLGTCNGDSGGPQMAYNETEKKWYLAGVTSYKVGGVCGSPYYPGVAQRVSKYTDWIRIQVSKYLEANKKF